MWKLVPVVAVVLAFLGLSTGASSGTGAASPGTVQRVLGAGGGGCAITLAPDARFAGEFGKIERYVDRRMRSAVKAAASKKSRAGRVHRRR